MCIIFFFFKQKTAYEMRISDWSSDVCSSDLQAEDDLDQPAETARGITEGKAQAGDDDDDHRDDLGDRTLDALEDRLERRFPGHRRAARMGRDGDDHRDEDRGRGEDGVAGAMPGGTDHEDRKSTSLNSSHYSASR